MEADHPGDHIPGLPREFEWQTSTELEDLLSYCISWVHGLGMLRALEYQEFCSPGCALKVRKELSGCLPPGHQLCWVSLGSVIWVLWEEKEQAAEQRWEDERLFFCSGQLKVPCSAVKISLIVQQTKQKTQIPPPQHPRKQN